MTEVLLAHAFFLRFDPKQWRTMQPYAPLGTLYAASYLRQHGFKVALFDAMLAESPEQIRERIIAQQPRAVVFYEDSFNWLSKMCLTRMREACFRMIAIAKKFDLPVIVAGSDATDHRELYFERGADYAIIGEGEISLKELLEVLLRRQGKKTAMMPGVALPQNGSAQKFPARGFLKELDVLPFPAWDLLEMQQYRQAWLRSHGYFSVNLVTTRGCPFKCNWCAKPIYGNRYNSRSPQNVVAEMLWLREHFQPDHIWFADDIFGLKPGWMEEFSEEVHRHRAVIPFKIQSRVDLLHEKAVAALAQAGCKTVWVGAESGSQKILDAMDKGTTVEQIYLAAERLKRHGLAVCFFLQFGYPGETDEDIELTIKMVRDCQPDDIGISVSYPLPGTVFFERVKTEMGEKHNWEHSDDLDVMFAGRYEPGFYRQLHRVVHHEFRLHQAAHLATDLWRRPSDLTIDKLRRLLAATVKWPLSYLERARLNRLRVLNPRHPEETFLDA